MRTYISIIWLIVLSFPLFGFTFSGVFRNDLVSGKKIAISTKKNPVARVVAFISAKCPCSASHEKELKQLSEEFKNVEFIGFHSNQDEPSKLARNYFSKAHIGFSVFSDKDAKIADELGAFKTPHVFVFDSKSKLIYQGGVDDSHSLEKASKHYLREVLNAVRDGRQPPYSETRTLGCVIRRSA
ncbi:MAG: redoxin family protein [Bacteriovoracia bacterium]